MAIRTWSQLYPSEKIRLTRAYQEGPEALGQAAGLLEIRPGRTLVRECQRYAQAMLELGQVPQKTVMPPVYISPSQERLNRLFEESRISFEEEVRELSNDRYGPTRLMFISDEQYPYDDPRVRNLICQIGAEFEPHFRTIWNDCSDFHEYSTHWEDTRSAAAKLWTSDIQNGIDYIVHRQLEYRDAMPGAFPLPVLGNHCIRLHDFLMQQAQTIDAFVMAEFYEQLFNRAGMIIFGLEENEIQLSPGLKIVHGIFATTLRSTVAKKTLTQLAGRSYENNPGQYFNAIHGHTHRSYMHQEHGVTCYSSGMCARISDDYPTFVKLGRPDWDQAIVLATYEPTGNRVAGELVRFYPHRNGKDLATIWHGKEWVSE